MPDEIRPVPLIIRRNHPRQRAGGEPVQHLRIGVGVLCQPIVQHKFRRLGHVMGQNPLGQQVHKVTLPGQDLGKAGGLEHELGKDLGRDAQIGRKAFLPQKEPALKPAVQHAIEIPGDQLQNSTPACALMPERKGCLISVISVTRSAISIRPSAALRPVRTTWVRGGFSSRRN